MKKIRIYSGVFLLLSLFILGSCSKNKDALNQSVTNQPATLKSASIIAPFTVFASDFSFPRGLTFGPDGYLYVALAGTGGTDSTSCTQVIPPVGPYKGGNTSKIIKISPSGIVSTVADNLPSDINKLGSTSGVSDVVFIGDQLYALLVAGCSHGNANYPSAVLKVNRKNGKWSVVADLSTYFLNNKVAVPEPDDFEPDGTPYSMVNVKGVLYVIEPNHGEMVKVTKNGKVTRVIDFSAHYGHIVPTVVAVNHGNFFVGNLTVSPFVLGTANILKVTPGGEVKIWETGFSSVLGVAFDKEHRLYVLETSGGGGFIPLTGRVVRLNKDKSRDIIVDKLFFPTGITFGPDGALYISNTGFGPPTGQIVKVAIQYDKDMGDRQDDN